MTNKYLITIILVVTSMLLSTARADTDITFYGRVVDGDNAPIAAASVKARIQSADKSETITVSTDADGQFSITGAGESLQILTIYKKATSSTKTAINSTCFNTLPTTACRHFSPTPKIRRPTVSINREKPKKSKPIAHSTSVRSKNPFIRSTWPAILRRK
ncbi:carboxypeptidase regulatory-like domain-containing protein [candidate division KSB1 bacterium]|nr:carboxypeptidase regulatory-like domain-containing protein [candidate division KSB1 bacterium]